MRRSPVRVALIASVAFAVAAAVAFAVVRPRIPVLGIGPRCALTPADGGFRRVDTLRRIAVLADGSAWAVGSRYSGAVGQPVAFRWRDGAWRAADVPSVSEKVTSGLHDVASIGSTDAWAVGSIRARTPFVVRWDGTTWSDVPTEGVPEDAEAEWLGVAASRAGGVLAVGKVLDGLAYRTLVGRLDGGRLVAERGPNVGAGNNVLADVDLRGDTAWAVGWTVEDGVYRTLAARAGDDGWIIEPTPDPGAGDDVLTTVAVVDADTAWAVGWSRDLEGEPTPLVLRWDGATWRAVRPPAAAGRLLAVAAAGGRVLVVGDAMDGARRQVALAYARIDGRWEEVPTPDPEDRWFTGVALVGETGAIAVGPQVVGSRYGSFLATGC